MHYNENSLCLLLLLKVQIYAYIPCLFLAFRQYVCVFLTVLTFILILTIFHIVEKIFSNLILNFEPFFTQIHLFSDFLTNVSVAPPL